MAVTTDDVWTGFRSRLYGYIRARSRSHQDAEDILQDVFVKVHQRIGNLQDDAHLSSWLYRVTHNTIIDHYRRNRPVPVDAQPSDVAVEDVRVAEQQLAPFLRYLVQDLPETYREALTLTELEGLTQKEMGRRLGLSTSGAKSRVQRGRALLKEQLLECCRVELDCRGQVTDYERRAATPWPDGCPCTPDT